MKIPYLNGQSWESVTREERFFVAVLFMELRKNIQPFLNILSESKDLLDFLKYEEYEPAFEVCFYRDFLKFFKIKDKKDFSLKRTFDLVLFSEKQMIIIEAKTHEPFSSEQLNSIGNDKKQIENLFRKIHLKCPQVKTCALISDLYHPYPETINHFDAIYTWKSLSELYPDSKLLFQRANALYST